MKIKDRIKSLRRIRAGELLPNPKNWRVHPAAQGNALRGILAEVGWADAVLARETADGLMLIDGHLRAEVAPDEKIPVLVLDVSEEEGDKILATLDPLAGLATADAERLDSLLGELDFDNEELQKMLDGLKADAGIKTEAAALASGGQPTVIDVPSPKRLMSGSKEEKQPHPAQKPLECMARAIRNHPGDVYEPFMGSGTTMAAAEQLDRICYGLELSPSYVAVALERMAALGCKCVLKESGPKKRKGAA